MRGPLLARPVTVSLRAYRALLALYPVTFRRAFGEDMEQVFRDQAAAAWRSSGSRGLAGLWVNTVGDLASSLPIAYAIERSSIMVKAAIIVGALYVCTLAVVLGYSAVRFDEFYQRPAFSNVGAAEPMSEDAAVAAYEQALTGEFGRYRAFAGVSMTAATVLLGLGAGLFGLSQRSLLLGAIALAGGAVVTVLALSALPYMWFPLDRYPVAALWVMGGFPVISFAIAAGVITLGRLGPRLQRRRALPA